MLPHWRNELGWARETPWGLVGIVTLQSTAHCTAGSPTFTVQEPRRISWWLEKGKASLSSPGIRGKVGAKLLMTQREARKANQANRMDPSPSPHSPSHNWDFLLERLWFSSHLDLVWSCSTVNLVNKLQIAGFFLWIQRKGLKLLRTPISSFSFHRAFIKNLFHSWKLWKGDRAETLWYLEPKELRCPSV